jgi:hypothetical protein
MGLVFPRMWESDIYDMLGAFLPSPYPNGTSKDGMGKQRTDGERRVKSGRQVLPMMQGKKVPPDSSQNFWLNSGSASNRCTKDALTTV